MRAFAITAVMAAVLTAGVAPSHGAAAGHRVAFGAFPGAATQASTQAFESNIGRPLAYVRVYDRWDDTFPNVQSSWMRSTGHRLFLSIKARLRSGANVSWRAIADARPGSPLYADMVRWASQIKAYGLPMYVSFNHEPDTADSVASGSPAAFIAAWRTFVTVMQAQGVTNATWAWTAAARNFSGTTARFAPDYYPGDAWVGVIAIDAYNMYCKTSTGRWGNPWRSLATILAPFMKFAGQHPGPPLVLAEFGTPEDPADPTRKARWLTDVRHMFEQPEYSRFEAISYWNTLAHEYPNCDFEVTTSQAALNAYRAMAGDPFYSGSLR
jgi:hypothetical protein